MTGTAVEPARTSARGAGLAITEEERKWHHLIAKAHVYANGTMVPEPMRGAPDVVLAGMLMCRRLGFSEDAVPRLDVIEGRLEPPAQMYLGAVHVAGYDTDVIESTNDRCVIEISRPGKDRPLTIEFTIDDARRAGLLDEWVERWCKTSTGKNYKEKFILGRSGVDIPAWAAAEIKAGNVRHMDNWHKYPADMLFAKCAKRVVRRMAPEVLFGLADDVQRATATVTGSTVTVDDDDDIVVDGEIVPSAAHGDETDAVEREPQPPAPASALERRYLHTLIDQLDDGRKGRLRKLVKGAGIPPLDGPLFTAADAGRVADLIDEITKAEAPVRGSADVAEVGGAGPDPQAGQPASTYANNDDLGREF